MLDFVLIPIFALHLLAVNVATAAPLVCIWLRWRESRHEDAAAGAVGRYLARQSNVMLLWGSALGFGMGRDDGCVWEEGVLQDQTVQLAVG